jgi:hypothetical protein
MNLEDALAHSRMTFPSFPEEVFSLWFEDRIRSNGWPPCGVEWWGFLFGESITFWQNLHWEERTMTLGMADLAPRSLALAVQIVEAGIGRKNLMANYIPNTAERFLSCVQFIRDNNSVPGKILLLASHGGYEVIDGNHRIAALLAVQSQFSARSMLVPLQAWLALPPELSGKVFSD